MTYQFPVAETPDNLVWFAIGNQVVVPPQALGVPVQRGRVTGVALGKPGGTMIVSIEAAPIKG